MRHQRRVTGLSIHLEAVVVAVTSLLPQEAQIPCMPMVGRAVLLKPKAGQVQPIQARVVIKLVVLAAAVGVLLEATHIEPAALLVRP
jgi:hypothetical protein